MERIFVIAGNKKQFDFFIKSRCSSYEETKKYVYVSSDKIFRGYLQKSSPVILYGTYYQRRDIGYLLDILKLFEVNVIHEYDSSNTPISKGSFKWKLKK